MTTITAEKCRQPAQTPGAIHPVDEVPATSRLLLLALQHVMVMYTGAIAVPFIIGAALGLSQQQIAYLIQADLITCGIATLIQTIGIWRFGSRMPLMQGLTFACISPAIAIASDPSLAAGGVEDGLRAVYGAVIISGLFGIAMAPFGRYMVRAFPAVVVGSVLTVIGLSLLPVAIQYSAGGYGPDAGDPKYIAMAFTVLAIIIVANIFGKGFIRNISVLIGIVAGVCIAGFSGMLDLSAASSAETFALVEPFYFGTPTFHLVPILTMILVISITWVESVGDAIVIGEMVDKKPDARKISDLIRADGLSSVIGGMLNSFHYTAFSENVALVSITQVKSRWVVALAGVFLILLGMSPYLAAIVASVPKAVIGGAGFMMFGSLVVVGIKTLSRIDFETSYNNFVVVGVSVAMAMIAILKPDYFSFMPDWSQVFFKSPVIMGAMTAIILNFLLNGLDKKLAL
ncbi:nucleobase:cation symporter-2 family protein [Marinobacterium sp. YM272]|uniref:nucleobase:cation symporter-2 family protein n=1 Tax=Marinobacterium sp. YM272 TaxID=3421654 RepID=UPI003D7F93C8